MQNEQIAKSLLDETEFVFRPIQAVTVGPIHTLDSGVVLPVVDRLQPFGSAMIVVTDNDLSGKSAEDARQVILERVQQAYNRLLRLRGRTALATISLEQAGLAFASMLRMIFRTAPEADRDAVFDDPKLVEKTLYITVMDNKTGSVATASIPANLVQSMTMTEFNARAERECRRALDAILEMRRNAS